MHGTLMIFPARRAGSTGLANYFVPLQIGAADVASRAVNAMSYWVYLLGVIMVLTGLHRPGAP